MSVHRLRAVFLTLLAPALAACFDPPVQERLVISFGDDARVEARAEVVFVQDAWQAAVRDRLTAVRQEHLDQRDPWSLRFARLDAEHETYAWERSQGELVRVTRSARLDPGRLSDLFLDTSVRVSYTEREGILELSMYAGSSQRATRAQRSEYIDVVDQFSRDVARYLHAMDVLYHYLSMSPDRAVTVFAALIGENEDREIPTEEEAAMLDHVSAATDRVLAVLATGVGRAYSFEEISSLVNDPFPASIVILPNGEIVEMEGFVRDDASGGLRVPRVSLWSAFDSMRGTWLSPDPLVALVENEWSTPGEPLSPESLAEEPRFSRPPADWKDVRTALTARLEIAETYRARWIVRQER